MVIDMNYKINLDVFQGPMDLLLHLIDKAEIDIYDIPINIIAEQFISYIHHAEELNLDITGEFLVMAATLLEIKSKMLLPKDKNQDEEIIQEDEDPRAELVRKLVEYKKYKNVAQELRLREIVQQKVFFKPKEDLTNVYDEQLEIQGLKIELLVKSIKNIIEKNKKENSTIFIDEIQREEYTLEKCISIIKQKIEIENSVKFSDLIERDSTVPELITYFLSVLELIRMNYIKVSQKHDFSDLIIERN